MLVDAVVVAAGSSTRFGDDKLFAKLGGRALLGWTLAAFAACATVDRIIVVTRKDQAAEVVGLGAEFAQGKEVLVEAGGLRRRDSVEAGLRRCRARYAAIHDGARPLVTPALIEAVTAAAQGNHGAIAAIPVTDTVKEVAAGVVRGHPDRGLLWAAQTPQVVLRQAWLDAAGMGDDDETDDAAMLGRLGLDCVVVEGDPANIKVTRPWDIATAEAILRLRGVVA